MSRSADLLAVIRGLQKVSRALVNYQEKEIARRWANSSLRTTVDKAGSRTEDLISDAIVNRAKIKVLIGIGTINNAHYLNGLVQKSQTPVL